MTTPRATAPGTPGRRRSRASTASRCPVVFRFAHRQMEQAMKLWKRVSLAAMAGAYGALTVGAAVAAGESTGSSARVRRAAQPAVYWAYQPVRKPQTPEVGDGWVRTPDRKSTRLNSSHVKISYAVFCLKKKKKEE